MGSIRGENLSINNPTGGLGTVTASSHPIYSTSKTLYFRKYEVTLLCIVMTNQRRVSALFPDGISYGDALCERMVLARVSGLSWLMCAQSYWLAESVCHSLKVAKTRDFRNIGKYKWESY